ncbi:hypothetical protein IWX49DRAFT_562527 [Phyllosticta citricarpa]|uniref:Pentatricopeptide repeat domain-containing protein n=2 Tax=Phyllosticta TaxID=121621 RepID=A0ABR1ML38_9PEZI
MPTALDRLLARPSTLRLLRRIIAATHELPRIAPRRHLSALYSTYNTPNAAQEKKDTGDDPVVQRQALGEHIQKATHAKLRASPTKEDATEHDAAEFADEVQVEAWIANVQSLQRIHGNAAVKTSWEILRQNQVELPTGGVLANAMWGLYIAEDDLLESVFSYALDLKRRTGQTYDKLYEGILAHFFSKHLPSRIYEWHERLINDFPPAPGGLKMIASHVRGSKKSYKAFRWIYHRNNQHDVYDTIIPSLCDQGKVAMARNLHVWLLSRGDCPSGTRRAEEIDGTEKLPLPSRGRYKRRNTEHTFPSPSDPSNASAVYVRQLETVGMRPKKVDDEFCARLFATKALTIDFAIDCLLTMDCNEIGSLAMREIAFRSGDCESIVQNVLKIAHSGIAIKRTTYNRAIMRFAVQNKQELLRNLLETDHHPENFDDENLQRKLLDSYIRANDWPGINRTLAILTVSERNSDNLGWNILVCAVSKCNYLSWHDHIARLSQMLEEAEFRGFKITQGTLRTLEEQLRSRRPGRSPRTSPLPGIRDDIWFANVCCLALKLGTRVSHYQWHELFRRFGMTERFDHVYYLALWLTDFYTTTHNLPEDLLREFNHHFNKDEFFSSDMLATRGPLPRQPTDIRPSEASHPLRQIFNALTVRAFVAWSIRRDFIVPHKGSKKRPHHWTRSLVLLKILRQKGVYVETEVVRKELQIQLLRLFGRLYGIHDPLLRRQFRLYMRSRGNNPYSLAEMVEQANEAFGSDAEGANEEPLLDLKKVAEYIVHTGSLRLWRVRRWRIRHEPGRNKRAQKPQLTTDLWSQLKL